MQFGGLVGESAEMKKVFKTVERVAASDSTVLITGESGTGKELIAQAIHQNSHRSHRPMVTINCGAIPRELLESELFGHEKGSFTGAHRTRLGRFEVANGGTIFLDEIGDMSPDLQVKLLRVLQEQSFERVGSTSSIKVDIRVLAATHKDLVASIEEGTFREDLFYRLNVIPIQVPPLRHRKSDIPLLVSFFMNRMGGRRREDIRRMKSFSGEALQGLIAYDWPGNIRELENMMERLSVLVEEDVIACRICRGISGGKRLRRGWSAMGGWDAGICRSGGPISEDPDSGSASGGRRRKGQGRGTAENEPDDPRGKNKETEDRRLRRK